MSPNQKLNNTTESDTSNKAGDKQSKAKEHDLSATQVVGGALAAMTAAALGSQLSVAGTVVGAALASIIAAIAGSLYTASLRHTTDKVKTVWASQPNESEDPTVIEIVEDRAGHVVGQHDHVLGSEPTGGPQPRRRLRLNWKRVAVGALAAFGIAAASLTVFELVTGNALSGGEGTTIQQVREGKANQESDTEKESPAKKPTEEPTEEPTAAASEAPPTSQPRETPTSEATETTTAPTPQAEATTTAPEATPSSDR